MLRIIHGSIAPSTLWTETARFGRQVKPWIEKSACDRGALRNLIAQE
jgi:hypothetical protein